jgi:hypothetical protein
MGAKADDVDLSHSGRENSEKTRTEQGGWDQRPSEQLQQLSVIHLVADRMPAACRVLNAPDRPPLLCLVPPVD